MSDKIYQDANEADSMARWMGCYAQRCESLPFSSLETHFNLRRFGHWPNAEGLNLLGEEGSSEGFRFTDQQVLSNSALSYEEFIHQYQQIPTRKENWHDLFNALIWLSFSQTKSLFNRLHVRDIQQFGMTPRTSLRNHLTHFDECGIVLASASTEIPTLLREHEWHEAFVTRRSQWHTQVQVFVFGHANLEMLLTPFSGLTGKWLHVQVDENFGDLRLAQQWRQIDMRLTELIGEQAYFEQPRPLSPLPLLGIPSWSASNRDPRYYQNADYFRPKRAR